MLYTELFKIFNDTVLNINDSQLSKTGSPSPSSKYRRRQGLLPFGKKGFNHSV